MGLLASLESIDNDTSDTNDVSRLLIEYHVAKLIDHRVIECSFENVSLMVLNREKKRVILRVPILLYRSENVNVRI